MGFISQSAEAPRPSANARKARRCMPNRMTRRALTIEAAPIARARTAKKAGNSALPRLPLA